METPASQPQTSEKNEAVKETKPGAPKAAPKAPQKPSAPRAAKPEKTDDKSELPLKKRYTPKNGSILVPIYDKDKQKMEWVNTPASRFDEAAQNALFDFWRMRAADDDKFNIQAKIDKLLIEIK